MFSPRKRTVPLRCGISAISALNVVDLPAPLRPMSATTSPRSTWKESSNRICAAPYHALRFSTSSMAASSPRSWPRPGGGREGAAGSEIDLLHLRVVADGFGIAVGDHDAAGQHDDAVGIGEHHVHRMFGEQDRNPALDHPPLHQPHQNTLLSPPPPSAS